MTTASLLNGEAKLARALERAALLALCAFVAWGPLAQGSTFAGGRAGLTVLGLLAGGLYLQGFSGTPGQAGRQDHRLGPGHARLLDPPSRGRCGSRGYPAGAGQNRPQ